MAKRKRAAWKWVVGSLVVLIGGGWGVMKVAEVMAARDVEEQASKIRKLGYPTTVEEFVARLPKDESQNAAPLYLKAIAEFKRIGEPKDTFTDSGVLDTVTRARFVRETDGIYQILVQASQKEHCAFPRDWSKGIAVPYPEFPALKTFGRICAARAEVTAEAGDWRSALDSLQVGMRLSSHAYEPHLIAHLVGISIEVVQMTAFREIVAMHVGNPQFLQEAQAWLKSIPPVPDRYRGFDFEIVATKSTFDMFADNDLGYGMGGFKGWAVTAMFRTPLGRKRIESEYLRRMNDVLALPDQGAWEDVAKWKDFDHRAETDTSFIGSALGVLLPVYEQAARSHARVQGFRRMTYVALWVAEQRLQLGTLPHQLPDEERFRHPWTGERYVYIKRGEGFTIRSVGPNKVDDGGERTATGSRTDDNDVQIPREAP